MNYRVIASGSSGNCVIYKDIVMIDLGIKLKDKELITPFLDSLKIILLTHEHSDHIQMPLLKWIIENYPNIMIAYPEYMQDFMNEHLVKYNRSTKEYEQIEIPKFKVIEIGKNYNFGLFKLTTVNLYHDVDNCAYYIRFIEDDYSVFHATDTYTLDNIKIPHTTSLIAIEHHHKTKHYNKVIEEKISEGKHSHEIGARNVHLSFEDAEEFLKRNKLYGSEVLRLHVSSHEYYKDIELSYIYEGDKHAEN